MNTVCVCVRCGKWSPVAFGEDEPLCLDCWREAVGVCDFCGGSPASEYTSRIPPHESVLCCDHCFEYERSGFDGF